jgi:methanogenic corrinoid protein MtbC1
MTIVGQDFRDGILFVPEVLLAANAMKGGMSILKPLLAETGAPARWQKWSLAPSKAISMTLEKTLYR